MRYSVPNILSFARIVLAPLIYQMIITRKPSLLIFSLILFVIGALTDYFDGVLARKWGESSSFGSFFDPLADKILTSAAFLAFSSYSIIPLWMVLIVVFRDIITTMLRMYADSIGQQIKTSYSAKFKTFLQLVFIIIILLILALQLDSNPTYSFVIMRMTWWGMFVITILTVYTTIEYLVQNKHILTAFKNQSIVSILYTGVGTFLGTGFSSIAPGTIASLFAMLILFFDLSSVTMYALIFITILISIPSISYLEVKYGNDASLIVIDEVVGMWLILSLPTIPKTFIWNFAGLVLFRFFDILKPFPINLINKNKGTFWVLFDDIIAVVFAAIVLYGLNIVQIGSNLVFMR